MLYTVVVPRFTVTLATTLLWLAEPSFLPQNPSFILKSVESMASMPGMANAGG